MWALVYAIAGAVGFGLSGLEIHLRQSRASSQSLLRSVWWGKAVALSVFAFLFAVFWLPDLASLYLQSAGLTGS